MNIGKALFLRNNCSSTRERKDNRYSQDFSNIFPVIFSDQILGNWSYFNCMSLIHSEDICHLAVETLEWMP